MTQTVKIYVESTARSLFFSIWKATGTTTTFHYQGQSAGAAFVPNPETPDLESSSATVALQIPQMPLTAQFLFTEITAFQIDGVDQIDEFTPIVTDLRGVVSALAPYFFVDGVADIAIDYPVTSATTELDFATIGQATIIQLTSADSAMTISRILNIPANREIKIFPPLGATLTITRRMQVAMDADWQILSDGNHTVQGSNGEWVKVSKFVSATWTICRVDSYKTNLF